MAKLKRDWCHEFMASHSDDISLRRSEPTSTARARAFNQEAVNAFFDLLETVQDAKRFTPDRVYSVDETGITIVPNRPSKIIDSRGKETGWFTVVCCEGTTCYGRNLHECCWIIYTRLSRG